MINYYLWFFFFRIAVNLSLKVIINFIKDKIIKLFFSERDSIEVTKFSDV